MSQAPIELQAKDLDKNGSIHCPSAEAHMKLWSTHPRVYLNIAAKGEAKCPYCGTVYRLKAGEQVHAH